MSSDDTMSKQDLYMARHENRPQQRRMSTRKSNYVDQNGTQSANMMSLHTYKVMRYNSLFRLYIYSFLFMINLDIIERLKYHLHHLLV